MARAGNRLIASHPIARTFFFFYLSPFALSDNRSDCARTARAARNANAVTTGHWTLCQLLFIAGWLTINISRRRAPQFVTRTRARASLRPSTCGSLDGRSLASHTRPVVFVVVRSFIHSFIAHVMVLHLFRHLIHFSAPPLPHLNNTFCRSASTAD